MKYEQIKYVKRPVSKLVFGCAFPAMINGEDLSDVLDAAIASGINTFDTAENYGKSELVLGEWIKSRGIRNDVVVISKGYHPYGTDRLTVKELCKDLDNSLIRLKTDSIDVYMLHRDVLSEPVGPIVEKLNEYHKAGHIGSFGGSNWSYERISEANTYAAEHSLVPFSVTSPGYSLAIQYKDPWGGSAGCVSLSGNAHKKDRQWYADNDITVFAYSSLAHGMFSGRLKSAQREHAAEILDDAAMVSYCYDENFARLKRTEELASQKGCTVSQIALAYLLSQKPLRVFPVITATKAHHLSNNVGALDITLSAHELDYLEG